MKLIYLYIEVPANQVLDNYTAILCDVLKVRIPAMPDFYVNDFQHARENVNKATGDIILSIDQSASIEFKERVLEVARYYCWGRFSRIRGR